MQIDLDLLLTLLLVLYLIPTIFSMIIFNSIVSFIPISNILDMCYILTIINRRDPYLWRDYYIIPYKFYLRKMKEIDYYKAIIVDKTQINRINTQLEQLFKNNRFISHRIKIYYHQLSNREHIDKWQYSRIRNNYYRKITTNYFEYDKLF